MFTVDPGVTRDRVAGWVWQVFDWIGLPSSQVHLVTEPLYVAELRVAPQAEMLAQVAPEKGYLDLIAPWAAKVSPQPSPLTYVARTGLPQKGGGAHAGESYLVQVLRHMGVAVVDPASASLATQMSAYLGAERLVFAEGSALHGRQLLGRVPQRIDVLRRRPGKSMAKAALGPRCKRLTYHDVSSGQLMAYWPSGAARPDPALCLYDRPRLFDVWRGMDIDLAPHWDDVAFRRCAAEDIAAWTRVQNPKRRHLAEHRAVIASAGLEVGQ